MEVLYTATVAWGIGFLMGMALVWRIAGARLKHIKAKAQAAVRMAEQDAAREYDHKVENLNRNLRHVITGLEVRVGMPLSSAMALSSLTWRLDPSEDGFVTVSK